MFRYLLCFARLLKIRAFVIFGKLNGFHCMPFSRSNNLKNKASKLSTTHSLLDLVCIGSTDIIAARSEAIFGVLTSVATQV